MKALFFTIALLMAQVAFGQEFQSTILVAHNTQRSQPLQEDASLNAVAQRHAEWMAANKRLQHQSLNGIMQKWRAGGENIACGQCTEKEVMGCWMKSPGHRANILNRTFTHAGFGIAVAKDGTVYWCVDFGG